MKQPSEHQEILHLVYFSSFTVSVRPSVDRPESSSDFKILIKLSISSLKMNQVNPFPALTAPRSLIFCSNLSIAAKAP